MLAKRLIEGVGISPTQHAFQPEDECAVAVTALDQTFKSFHARAAPLYLASLDVTKAFDEVSPEAILMAARKAGIPGPLLRYLGHLRQVIEGVRPYGYLQVSESGVNRHR